MKSIPRISEAEWEVLAVLWKENPLTAVQVVQALSHHGKWKDATIRTLLGRLVQKGAITFTAEGRVYFYRPAVSRAECVQQAGQSFLERVFEGATGSLVLHFVETKRLTQKELAELEAILHEKQKGNQS